MERGIKANEIKRIKYLRQNDRWGQITPRLFEYTPVKVVPISEGNNDNTVTNTKKKKKNPRQEEQEVTT